MAISARSIEQVKNLPPSAVLAAEGVELKRVGREFITRCVWHDDTNPSLTIADQKGFLFCHVCRASGDSINYIQQKYGLSFREAVERIARNHNIQVNYVDENSEDLKKRKLEQDNLYGLVESRQQSYRKELKESGKAIAFLKHRKILATTSREFGLGYDKSRNRITIPIHNSSGKLVGFSARSLGAEKPKYINTENNLIFNKSDLVFNEFRALEHIRDAGECIFVEGHFDVISLWQAGIKNVVALQGTASPDSSVINRLLRRTSRFILCMDADEGGRRAISTFLKSVAELSFSGKLDVRIASLSEGKDPDEAIKAGVDMRAEIIKSVSWIDWVIDNWLDNLDFQDSVKFNEIENQIKELVSKISSPSLRAYYFDKAALRLAQNRQNLAAQIAKSFHDSNKKHAESRSWRIPTFMETRKNVEKRLLRLYLHRPNLREILRPLMGKLYYTEMIWLWKRIEEIEQFCDCQDFSLFLMAILMVAEPQYLQHLRPIITPTIKVDDSSGVILHIEDTMLKEVPQDLG